MLKGTMAIDDDSEDGRNFIADDEDGYDNFIADDENGYNNFTADNGVVNDINVTITLQS